MSNYGLNDNKEDSADLPSRHSENAKEDKENYFIGELTRRLTLDPVKPMNCRSFVILGGSSDITRLKVPTPSWTPPSKCDLNLSSFSDQFLPSRISQQVLEITNVMREMNIQQLCILFHQETWILISKTDGSDDPRS